MSRAYAFAVALLYFALPSDGSAADLFVRTSGSISYRNISEVNEDRVTFGIRVPIELRIRPDGRYSGGVAYTPQFELQPTAEFKSRFNHFLTATGGYALSRRASVAGSIRFADVGFIAADAPDSPDGTLDRRGYRRNNIGIQSSYVIAARWSVNGSIGHGLAEFKDPGRTDSQNLSGNLEVAYGHSERDRFALGMAPSYTFYSPSLQNLQPRSDVTSLGFFVRWTHSFTRDLSLRVNFGPTVSLFDSQPLRPRSVGRYALSDDEVLDAISPRSGNFLLYGDGSCSEKSNDSYVENCQAQAKLEPAVIADPGFTFQDVDLGGATPKFAESTLPVRALATEQQVNFFGGAALSYTRARWIFNLNFNRSQSDQSGYGTSTSLDALGLIISWNTSQRWTFGLRARASLRKSLNESPVVRDYFVKQAKDDTGALLKDDDGMIIAEKSILNTVPASVSVNRKQASVQLSAARQMTRRLRLTIAALYNYQTRRRLLDRVPRSQFRLDFGISYSFRPVHL